MGRTIKNQNIRRPKPVEKIRLSEKHLYLRVFLVILLLAVAAVSFTYALTSYLKEDTGWKVIKVSSAAKANVGDEFTFQYELGGGETSATAEYKALTILYSDAAVKAYEIFSADESFEDVVNLYELNQHPGEVLTVEEPLYQALELLETYGNRNLYLGPVYEEMYNLFQCKEDYETASFDPEQNEVLREEFAALAAFAADPEAIDLKLLGENQVYIIEEDNLGGENFSEYSSLVPAVYMFVGIKPKEKAEVPGLHSPLYQFDDTVLAGAAGTFAMIACQGCMGQIEK